MGHPLSGVRVARQNFGVAGQGRAPAAQNLPAKLGQARDELGLLQEPVLVPRDGLGARRDAELREARFAVREWIAER